MELPTALLRDLFELARSIGSSDDALAEPLADLFADVRAAVPSYCGLHVKIIQDGHVVGLAALLAPQDQDVVATSLWIPFTAFGAGFEPGSGIVFYAAAPGAFVDLAADLGYALHGPMMSTDGRSVSAQPASDGEGQGSSPHIDSPGRISLDRHLPPVTMASGLIGVRELSAINRAVGILIDQGHPPHLAHDILRRQAVAVGVEPHVYAARMLQR